MVTWIMTTREEIEELLQTSENLKKHSERLRCQQKELKKKIRALKAASKRAIKNSHSFELSADSIANRPNRSDWPP
jgi:hypothetical protein